MSAIATEKVETNSLNLGFPYAYASVYSAARKPLAYFPSVALPSAPYSGDDEVQALRLSRKADADYMARAKVQATHISDRRYTSTPHGMGFIPKPVLGQRIFANGSNGAFETSSARRDVQQGPFHYSDSLDSLSTYRNKIDKMKGGVLRTKEGQAYGKARLMDRIGQLDRIDESEAQVGLPPAKQTTGQIPGSLPGDTEQIKIQLDLAIQQLQDGVNEADGAIERLMAEADQVADDEEAMNLAEYENESQLASSISASTMTAGKGLRKLNAVVGNLAQFGFGQFYQMMKYIFVLAPEMSEKDLNELNSKISAINSTFESVSEEIVAYVNEHGGRGANNVAVENMLSLRAMLTRLSSYCDRMVEGVNKSDDERRILSNSLIKSLKFGKDLKRTSTPFLTGLVHPDEQRQIRLVQNDLLAENPPYTGGARRSKGGIPSEFSRRGAVREDSEQTVARGDRRGFSAQPRESFGYASGEWYQSNGRDSSAYFNQPIAQNSSGPGYEALKAVGKPVGLAISKRYDKITGGYNVAFN